MQPDIGPALFAAFTAPDGRPVKTVMLPENNLDLITVVRGRNGFGLMPELGYTPLNQYLPPRPAKPIPVQMSRSSVADRVNPFANADHALS